ncbi:MAG: M20/M25/M40 family metallo-hydrolase [Thermoanaerobaculales bacterium]|jgi:hypothetical protein|nr:M20/M25/M40 family metallo-hydrolase [Thermoanaerobaculales bacterium]
MTPSRTPLTLALLATSAISAAAAPTHHELTVRLDPAGHRIEVVDRLLPGSDVAPDDDGAYPVVLHAGLEPVVVTPGWRIEPAPGPVEAGFFGINATTATVAENVPLEGWRLHRAQDAGGPVEIRYAGVIHHELRTQGEEYQRSFSETPGIISADGVFLAGASFWVPSLGDGLVTFSLAVEGLEPPWDVVSQGRRTRHELAADGTRTTAWSLEHPTEEVYLVAGPWVETAGRAGEVDVYAFLRGDDPSLAGRYLDATRRYLELYNGMLPPYPYPSFALVENFWETGYGMPGFTLLGPQVIRFPWILTSSYPHELLHNWWGNSVFVDPATGNWCEGLTAYLADHLFAEQRGEGADYRRATLKKFTDLVGTDDDFPLAEFGSRHSAASEAVGYGKSLMLFHMLRRAMGDEAFLASLGRFDREHRFSRASFADIAGAMRDEVGGDWPSFVEVWVGRTGAPSLEIVDVKVTEDGGPDHPHRLSVRIRQTQEGDPFPLTIPVAVTVEGAREPVWGAAGTCGGRDCVIEVRTAARPLRLDVDPAFDVMRRLDPLEVPPALTTLFGAEDPLFVLPAAANPDELAAWRELAAAWARPGEPRIALDRELEELPAGSVWLLGWDNAFAGSVGRRLADQGAALGGGSATLPSGELPRAGHSLVLVARAESDPADALGLVAADPVAAIPGLARKLPHYTRYSYLGFAGDEPANVAKGQWRPLSSPLVRNLGGGELVELELPPRPPLAELPAVFDAARLSETVERLTDPIMEGRGLGSAGLEHATLWLERQLGEARLTPAGEDGYRQRWTWRGGVPERLMPLTNLVATVSGTDPSLPPVLVMAHLDHLGEGWPDVRAGNEGQVHPGADDNASGVAVLLELARTMAGEPARPRTVLFAAVTGEEAGRIGSKHLLEGMPAEQRPFACLNLDTVGRLADGALYVLNSSSAREWPFIFMGVGHTTGAPVKVVAEPLDSSDQMSCIELGIPAVQLFTGPTPDYHRPSDTAETIDAEGMATVAEAAHEAVAYLAERREPLTVTIAGAAATAPGDPGAAGPRRASLGTMPDFGFAGPGVKVQQVLPGSPAEAAGIAAGDVLVALDGEPVADLRGYSALLKTKSPGDSVEVTILRDGGEVTVTATLGER